MQRNFVAKILIIILLIITPTLALAEMCEIQQSSCEAPPDTEPTGPGNDHPDDNFAVDSGNPPAEPYFEADPMTAILRNGFQDNFLNLLASSKSGGIEVSPEGINLIQSKGSLVIPSGGLNGLDKSAFFKAFLDEYVRNGGTLVVFAQQHGYEFNILPVA